MYTFNAKPSKFIQNCIWKGRETRIDKTMLKNNKWVESE